MQKRKCVECGKEFTISDSEEKFFEEKHLSLPTHCKECREKRKHENKNQENHRNSGTSQDNGPERAGEVYVKSNVKWLVGVLLIIVAILAFTKLPQILHPDETQTVSGQTAGETEPIAISDMDSSEDTAGVTTDYTFRSNKLLTEHFEKHGGDFDYADKEAYQAGANAVISNPDALTKTESEDGDYVYYVEDTNEFVILSTDGYIRTYFKPSAGIDYFNRQ